jgi:hypothetical protein
MTTLINASTSAGLVQTADTSGNLSLQSGGTTILALTSTGAAVTGTLSASGATTLSSTLSSTSFSPTSATVPANGVYLPAATTVGISTNSVHCLDIGVNGSATLYAGAGSTGAWQWLLGDVAANDMSLAAWTGAAFAHRINITNAGVVRMQNYGAGSATFSATGVISSVSDQTWKTKDGAPSNPNEMINKLEPGYWFYNDEKKDIFGSDRQLGFYAQNVNAAIGPEAAPIPEEGKPWGYYDRSVLAVVVMSLKSVIAKNEALEARLAALEAK